MFNCWTNHNFLPQKFLCIVLGMSFKHRYPLPHCLQEAVRTDLCPSSWPENSEKTVQFLTKWAVWNKLHINHLQFLWHYMWKISLEQSNRIITVIKSISLKQDFNINGVELHYILLRGIFFSPTDESSFPLMGVTICEPPCNPPGLSLIGVIGLFSGDIRCCTKLEKIILLCKFTPNCEHHFDKYRSVFIRNSFC
jgi:hypothetical protein